MSMGHNFVMKTLLTLVILILVVLAAVATTWLIASRKCTGDTSPNSLAGDSNRSDSLGQTSATSQSSLAPSTSSSFEGRGLIEVLPPQAAGSEQQLNQVRPMPPNHLVVPQTKNYVWLK